MGRERYDDCRNGQTFRSPPAEPGVYLLLISFIILFIKKVYFSISSVKLTLAESVTYLLFLHLYDRDCSSQRRHQKLIEEAPAPGVDQARREKVCASAAELIRRAKYAGAATCEFLMDTKQNFYMLEVNTRVQVEHPISEAITGVDIVQTGIRVAAGEALPFKQSDIHINGHAMEFRINAEDPARNFMPQAGLIETWSPPGGLGIRLDSHVCVGYRVPTNYDSMIGKLIVHAPDRESCIRRSLGALGEFKVGPIRTTIPLYQRLLKEPMFTEARHDIKYVERLLAPS